MTDGEKIAGILERQNLNQADLAKLLEVSPSIVSMWISGDRNMPRSMKKLFKYVTGEEL